MLYREGLWELIFCRYKNLPTCDEMIVISGYIGPNPIRQLGKLPLNATVIYGMYGSEGIQKSLHSALVKENEEINNLKILYSSRPVHSKCYIWRNKGKVIHALIGSANFSNNGLLTPDKEVLAETTNDTFEPLNNYYKQILEWSIPCKMAVVKNNKVRTLEVPQIFDPEVCELPLYIVKDGKKIVPEGSGINWGMAKLKGSHVNIDDAYIKISMNLVEQYPQLFPRKSKGPKNLNNVVRIDHRDNDNIEIIWDDGTTMTGLLEGTIPRVENGEVVSYPKQIASTPRKSQLGKYLRKRLGIPSGKFITLEDLQRYGRDYISVSLQGEGIYYFDFSVKKEYCET